MLTLTQQDPVRPNTEIIPICSAKNSNTNQNALRYTRMNSTLGYLSFIVTVRRSLDTLSSGSVMDDCRPILQCLPRLPSFTSSVNFLLIPLFIVLKIMKALSEMFKCSDVKTVTAIKWWKRGTALIRFQECDTTILLVSSSSHKSMKRWQL